MMEDKLYEHFRKIVKYQRRQQQLFLEQYGLYYGQPRVLLTIYHNDNITQSQLVEKLHVSKESVSMSIKRLTNNGIVERKTSEHDKRVVILSLSEQGRTLIEQVMEGLSDLNHSFFSMLDEDEYRILGQLFEKIYDTIDEEIA